MAGWVRALWFGFGMVWLNFMILTLLPAFLSLSFVSHVYSLCLPRILVVVFATQANLPQASSIKQPMEHQHSKTQHRPCRRQSVQKSGVNSLISLSSSRTSLLKTRLAVVLACGVRSSFSSPAAPAATPILPTRWPS